MMRNQKILVVDDDKSIINIVQAYLEQAGYGVLTASNGSMAMNLLHREKPDLLILDLMLPDRDGLDVTRSIRQDKRLATTPIIMLTARVEDSDKIVGLELGADDYITKPFNPRELVARVRSSLRRTQREQAEQSNYLEVGPILLDLGARTLALNGQLIEVTPTEFNLLKIFMESPGHTFGRELLLEMALGYG